MAFSIGDLFGGGGASNINIPTMSQAPSNVFSYDPSQIAPTQTSMLGGIQNLGAYNLAGSVLPQAWGIGQGMVNDPNAAFYQGGAGTAAGMGMGAAGNQFAAGQGIYDQAFDPQGALFQKYMNMTTDAARANAAAAGLATTPVGVGATDWAQNNFMQNWQNQQLQRMMQGGQMASQLQAGAAPLFMQSAAYPWATSQGIGGQNLGTLGQLGNFGLTAAQIPGQQIQGWQQGLGIMGGLQQQANAQQQQQFMDAARIAQLQLEQQKLADAESSAAWGGIGKLAGGLGGFALGGLPGAMIGSSLFGGGGGLGGGGQGGSNIMSQFSSKPFGGLFSF